MDMWEKSGGISEQKFPYMYSIEQTDKSIGQVGKRENHYGSFMNESTTGVIFNAQTPKTFEDYGY